MYASSYSFLMESGVSLNEHWNFAIAPLQVWGVWFVCFPIVIGINEFIKRKEIKVETRHQRRQKLDFGTKSLELFHSNFFFWLHAFFLKNNFAC